MVGGTANTPLPTQDKDGDGLVTVEEIVEGLGVTEKEAAKILKKHGGKGALETGISADQVIGLLLVPPSTAASVGHD